MEREVHRNAVSNTVVKRSNHYLLVSWYSGLTSLCKPRLFAGISRRLALCSVGRQVMPLSRRQDRNIGILLFPPPLGRSDYFIIYDRSSCYKV